MATFKPYKLPIPLPNVGDGFEHATLDIKAQANLGETFHLAKDVAAFANHLGGTLIIGAAEDRGRIGAYVPQTEKTINETQNAYSKAVTDRCSPRPLIDFGRYPQGTGFILTVLVWPYWGQLVGVRAAADKAKGGYGGDTFAFPVRSGSDSIFLLPEQMSMYMVPEVRKAIILLEQIPKDAQIQMHTVTTQGTGAPYAALYRSLDIMQNCFVVTKANQKTSVSIPFEAVRSVWKTGPTWQVAVKGAVLNDDLFHWQE